MLYEDIGRHPNDDMIARLLDMSNKLGNLPHEELVDLVLAAQSGDEQALDRFVVSNFRFCHQQARKMMGMGVELLDLTSEAVIGLIEGVEKYSYRDNSSVLTYLEYWVRRRLIATVCEDSRTIRIPRKSASKWAKIRAHIAELEEGRRPVCVEEIAEMFSVTPHTVKSLILSGPGQESLNETTGGMKPVEVQDLVFGGDLNEIVERADEASWIRGLIDKMLTEREIKILYGYFWEEKILEEIGVEIGLTRERVRQIKVEAFAKLKIAIVKEREAVS